MKKYLLFILFIFFTKFTTAQSVDSIYFHLYTDSLKKGTYNYINVDGKLSNGKWKPLTEKEIIFSASYGTFSGNELILPVKCTEEKVKIKAVLKEQPWKYKEIVIWIKKNPDNEKLPTREEVLKNSRKKKKN